MNLYFDGKIANNLKDPDTTVTVFRKKEEKWEKLTDPFYTSETKDIPKIEYWRKSITISLTLNKPVKGKECKVLNVENGSVNGPTPVGNFKWELEITSNYETWQDPNNTTFSVEINDGSN